MSKISAGVIGCGFISDYHIRGYLDAGVKVAAVADIDLARAQTKAKKYKMSFQIKER